MKTIPVIVWNRVPPPLQQYRILVADADHQLSVVLKTMLTEMGFTNVQLTRSGQDALALLAEQPFDFVITEWNIQHMDGIELLNRIRRDSHSANPTLPVIMLTGRAEQSDVVTARDHGINEYVIKPFSAKAIFNRLERIIEYPRPFVVSKHFVGPDRRHRGAPPEGVAERRKARLVPQHQPKDAARELVAVSMPKLWLPDYSLKKKLSPEPGSNVALQSLITPAVLTLAQASIDAITSDSLQWIKADLAELRALSHLLPQPENQAANVINLRELALKISSRAGTFGYTRASEVAYMLYLFCRKQLQPAKAIHQTIVQKHIDVLQVILSSDLRGAAGDNAAAIVTELQALVQKYGG